MARLDGKVAIVLGASASGGTGWAIAEALAAHGAKVVVGARSLAPLQILATRIGGLAVRCDAASASDIEALIAAATAAYGKIDVAVNSAGLPVLSSIAEVSAEQVQAALEVNYIANVHFVKHAAAAMNDGGSIVLISSSSSMNTVQPHFAYACAKAATDCLVRYAALEYGPRGIRVNAILPGPIKSDMAAGLFELPGVEAVFAREVPLGRIGMPSDYADAVLWLAGPAYISGAQLPISGGNQLTRSPRPDELPLSGESYSRDRDAA